MGISDWSSDVCSSDLIRACATIPLHVIVAQARIGKSLLAADEVRKLHRVAHEEDRRVVADQIVVALVGVELQRSEEHTSELQSLMRNSYAVFCLTTKITPIHAPTQHNTIRTIVFTDESTAQQ